ncbi:MAG: class I SAM-dependent rRNA methyltransferase [Candidatus Eiseniibacteriota bacterium]
MLRPRAESGLHHGYPWIFANQVAKTAGWPVTGDAVRIESSDGTALGLGLFHETSQIQVRFLTPDLESDVDQILAERVRRAFEFRRRAFADFDAWRLLHGESDGVPGTVVDRYGDVLVWSTVCAGIERRREGLLYVLEEVASPRAIVQRDDNWLRAKDGLDEARGVLRGALDGPVLVEEAGLTFEVDVLDGPKTGAFLDQRFHRIALRRFAAGRSVLDAFCADGGFGLHAAAGGATEVLAVDSSDAALQRAARNAERNGLRSRFSFERANLLDRIVTLVEEERRFDLVVLDPPAFAKSRKHVDAAVRSYQLLNINALRLLSPGGILATSSCSTALPEKDFEKILRYSAQKAECRVRLLFRGSQPADHPVLPSMPETAYLKFVVLQKLGDELPGP